jgi:hypothetical protein
MYRVFEDTIKEENRITDETIENLKELRFQTIDDGELIAYLHFQCQKLLEFAKEKNESKEIARAINLSTLETIGTAIGDSRSVNIDQLIQQMKSTDYAFLVIHNHPSNMYFSRRDVRTFIDSDNIAILIVIGNNGAIYIIEKTRQLSLNELLSARKTLVDWKNKLIDFNRVIEQIGKFGIVYSEM